MFVHSSGTELKIRLCNSTVCYYLGWNVILLHVCIKLSRCVHVVFVTPGAPVICRRMGGIKHNTGRDWTENSHSFEAGVELVTEAFRHSLSIYFSFIQHCVSVLHPFYCYKCLFGVANVYSANLNLILLFTGYFNAITVLIFTYFHTFLLIF